MRTGLNTDDVLFQEYREDGAGYALVLHEILEHDVVDRVGNRYHILLMLFVDCKNKQKKQNCQAIRKKVGKNFGGYE